MSAPALAICLAACEPPAALWRRQLASLKAQTYKDWVCLVEDDASSPKGYALLKASLKGDRRFQLRRQPRRLGFYRNFEAALRRVPKTARYAAFCDQDDRWDPGKLAASVALLESSGAQLVHANLRLVDARGRVLAPSNWIAGANARVDLEMLSLANIVTGASAVFRRSLLDAALPFPEGPGPLYHDHWVAMVALSQGSLAYVDEPQYDYVQHGANTLGHGAPRQPTSLKQKLRGFRERWTVSQHRQPLLEGAQRDHRTHLLRAAFFARELRARLQGRLKPGAAFELALVQAAARSLPALALLCARGAWRRRDIYHIEPQLLEGALRLRLEAWGAAQFLTGGGKA